MLQNLELLQELSFFNNFPNKAMKLLAFMAERMTLAANDILLEEGDDYGQAYLLLSGQLALLRKSGEDTVVVRRYDSGDFLGSFSLLGNMPSLFSLQATTKSAILTISRNQFAKILEQFPETGKLALKALLKELHQWERQNLTETNASCLNKTGATLL